jgi:hypothetical protein
LLREAQQALPGAPTLALARLAEHRSIYPHGVLEQERQVLEVEALLAANRLAAAHEAATAFATDFAGSAHLRRIERMFARFEQKQASVGNTSTVEALTGKFQR